MKQLLIRFGSVLFMLLGLAYSSSGSFARTDAPEILPRLSHQIVKTLLGLDVEGASYGDPWALGKVIAEARSKHAETLRDSGANDFIGRRISWTREPFNGFVVTKAGLFGAVWTAGPKALLEYLNYRKRNGWIGRTSTFPSTHRKMFRTVEIGLIAFQYAAFKPPFAKLILKRGEAVHERPLINSLYRKELKKCPKCNFKLKDFGVGRFDLNNDGSLELFVTYPSAFCGTIGCATKIFGRFKGKWRRIGYFSSGDAVNVMHEVINGYHSIHSSEQVVRWEQRRSGGSYLTTCVSWKCWNEIGEYLNE